MARRAVRWYKLCMSRFPRVATLALAASVVFSFSATPAFAQSEVDGATLGALVQFNPGTTESQMLDFIVSAADRYGMTPAAFAASSLAEARASYEYSDVPETPAAGIETASYTRTASLTTASAEDELGATTAATSGTKLGTAQRKGDIFTAPATTLWIQHGHTGIYYTTATIIEAPGIGQVVKKTAASSIYVDSGAHKLYVTTTQAKRNAAADWAASKLGYGYNLFFADNKHVEDDVYNCSQLVWAAYKKKAGLDIDANGGASVYPVDIRNSSLTTSYKTF